MAEPTIEDLRAQRDELDRQLAAASVGAASDFVTLLASPEAGSFMTAITNVVEPLDAATRKRVAAWVKMRGDIATLAQMDLVRLNKLVGSTSAP